MRYTRSRARLEDLADPDIVLAGDFNDEIDDPPQWNVFGAFLDAPEVCRFSTQPVAEAGDFTYIPFESLIELSTRWTKAASLPTFWGRDAERAVKIQP